MYKHGAKSVHNRVNIHALKTPVAAGVFYFA